MAKLNMYVIGVPHKEERENSGRTSLWRNTGQNFLKLTKDIKPWIQEMLQTPQRNKLNVYKQNHISVYSKNGWKPETKTKS